MRQNGDIMLYASVRILNLPCNADKTYQYHVPLHLEGKTVAGSIVLVPFGGSNKVLPALVESVSDKKECKRDVKPVLAVPGAPFELNGELLGLCRYMRDTVLCSTGDAVKTMLPSGFSVFRTVCYRVNEEDIPGKPKKISDAAANAVFEFIKENGSVTKEELSKNFGPAVKSCLKKLVALGMCINEDGYHLKINEKNEKYAELCADNDLSEQISSGAFRLPEKQLAAYGVLFEAGCPLPVYEIMDSAGLDSVHAIVELSKKGIIRIFDVSTDRSTDTLTEFGKDSYGNFELSEEQNGAYEKLLELYGDSEAKAALLHGVTGSGKTNVILKLIDRVMADGKTVIVLVPEIALTSQTVGRFTARYSKNGIALLHSGLSAGEKADAKKKIAEGKARIVIGTRSAVFAPVENLGLIVMDEEHDSSFKSDKSPKYHARDIARFRCAYNNALLVMASATPLVESYYRAKSGRYNLISLNNRYGNHGLPEVSFYDMKDEPFFVMPEDKFDGSGELCGATENAEEQALPLILGKKMTEEISVCLENNEQAMLFINRRGYRAFALCRNCGYTFSCPHCSVSMTHHKDKRTGKARMVCHYCGFTDAVPDTCPECGKQRVTFVGSGTQLLEETLNKQFPKARVLRMDADTTGGKFSHERILSQFRNREADILVGTQMIAKGHDFPGVSLVGIALADTSLFVNDYRANEKTFSLLTQVLGRAGRAGTQGKAVLQTYVPDNDVLNMAANQDYLSFFESELAFRKANLFPPFCDIVTIGLVSEVESDLISAVKTVHTEIEKLAKTKFNDIKFILFGPFKNEIYRIAGKYRMRFIIKCRNNARTREMLGAILNKAASLKNVSASVDINPTSL